MDKKQQPLHEISNWLTVAQAAELLSLTTRQVKNLIPKRFPSAQKLPGRTGAYLLSQNEVDAEIKRRRQPKS